MGCSSCIVKVTKRKFGGGGPCKTLKKDESANKNRASGKKMILRVYLGSVCFVKIGKKLAKIVQWNSWIVSKSAMRPINNTKNKLNSKISLTKISSAKRTLKVTIEWCWLRFLGLFLTIE